MQPVFHCTMTQANTPQAQPAAVVAVDENQLIAERREKLKAMRETQQQGGAVAFPNDFKPADKAAALFAAHGQATKEALEAALAAGKRDGALRAVCLQDGRCDRLWTAEETLVPCCFASALDCVHFVSIQEWKRCTLEI